MRKDIGEIIVRVTGRRALEFRPLGGGCVGDVREVRLEGGGAVVAKLGDADSGLDVEGYMLDLLGPHLPVPAVLHAAPDLLVMTRIDGGDRLTAAAEIHAADLLARLHAVRGPAFGLERDTLIGGLPQPNRTSPNWIAFFRDRRLLHMAAEAHAAGRLPDGLRGRIDSLADRLERWLREPEHPSLIHGDMWTGNVLCRDGRIAGFVDPATYFADPEIELAFATLFGTFGDAFFGHYRELRPIAPGFLEERRDLYNLYPLLVHVRLFGGTYVGSVDAVLRRYGV